VIKVALVLLLIFWCLAFLGAIGCFAFVGTLDILIGVMILTETIICILGIVTCAILWRIVQRIERLEKKRQQVPVPP